MSKKTFQILWDLRSGGEYKIKRSGNKVSIDLLLYTAVYDNYDFNKGMPGHKGASMLEEYKLAKPFKVEGSILQNYVAEGEIKNGEIKLGPFIPVAKEQ